MFRQSAFTEWTPSKEMGLDVVPHPMKVLEPSNLALCALPPIEKHLVASFPHASLSTLQRETATRACASLEEISAFFLGDATGVGKGRVIASIFKELSARDDSCACLWVSANMRLRDDAIAELRHVEAADIDFKYASYASLMNMGNYECTVDFLCSKRTAIVTLDECHMLRNASHTAATVQHLLREPRILR